MADSSIKPFEEDFAEYKISTAYDGKVCPICRGVTDKIFKMADR